MKDELGFYYHPDPNDWDTRVYVRRNTDATAGPENEPQFRIWRRNMPQVWDKHGWIGLAFLENAARQYKAMGQTTDPMALYDANVAKALLQENERQ